MDVRTATSRAGWDDEPLMSPLNPDVLAEMVRQNHETAEEAHRRLRESLRDLEGHVADLEKCQSEARAKLSRLETALNQPPDLTRSQWPMRHVLSFFGTAVTVIVVIIGAAYSVKSDVRDVATRQEDKARLDDERILSLRSALEDMKKDLAMQRVQTESLTKLVISQQTYGENKR